MALTIIYALVGLILLAFQVYQRKIAIKYAMMILGFVLVFSASTRMGFDTRPMSELWVYLAALIVLAFVIQIIVKAISTRLAAKYPEWLRTDHRDV